MIVVINGLLGVGKSETSWELLYRLPRAVMLDMDHIAAFHPCDYYNQEHLDYAYATLRVLAEHHARHGFADFVLNWVLESADQIARLRGALAGLNLPVYVFRLWCDPEEIARRIRRRNRPDLAFELDRSRELAAILDEAARQGDLGTVINTTALTPEQTVDRIWEVIRAEPSGQDMSEYDGRKPFAVRRFAPCVLRTRDGRAKGFRPSPAEAFLPRAPAVQSFPPCRILGQ